MKDDGRTIVRSPVTTDSSGMTRRALCRFGIGVPALLSPSCRAVVATRGGRADDEAYWTEIRRAFPSRRGSVNLLNSGGGSSPQVVLDHLKQLIQVAAEGGEKDHPDLGPLKESGSSFEIRTLLASTFGCAADEIALTRNAMEGLAVGLLGVDLHPGDEVVTTRADYDSCIEILRQRERRHGVALKLIDIPMPARTTEEVVAAFEASITARTRVFLLCHMLNKNGQVLPVREICVMARRRGILTIVDGAQSVGHITFALRELECDVYATSLHKWFYAPRGTGFLYVRKDSIHRIWPIWASWSGKPAGSIEKFEDYGTVMKAVSATVPGVVAFNAAIGAARKEARLRHLRDLWLGPISRLDRVTLLTDTHPGRSCAIAAFSVDGLEPGDIVQRLRSNHQLIVGSIKLADYPGFRGVYLATDLTNSPDEIARFVEAMTALAKA